MSPQMLKRLVKPIGNSGHITLPRDMIGQVVEIHTNKFCCEWFKKMVEEGVEGQTLVKVGTTGEPQPWNEHWNVMFVDKKGEPHAFEINYCPHCGQMVEWMASDEVEITEDVPLPDHDEKDKPIPEQVTKEIDENYEKIAEDEVKAEEEFEKYQSQNKPIGVAKSSRSVKGQTTA